VIRPLRPLAALVKLSLLELWRRNDIFVLLVLSGVLLVPLAAAKPFGADGAARYMDEVALLLVWAYSFFIALGAGSRLFPPEFESRTLFPLLARPVSRARILFGKFLGAFTAAASAILFFYALYALACGCRTGVFVTPALVEAVLLHLAFAALATALALLGSLIVTPSMNLTVCTLLLAVMFFFGRRLPLYAHAAAQPFKTLAYAAYWIAPHAEFFDMRQRVVHGWGPADPAAVAVLVAYAVCYTAACLFAAAWILRRRNP